jgi:hypothetical protein
MYDALISFFYVAHMFIPHAGSYRSVYSKSFTASTISSSQLAIRIKIVYYCLVGGERGGERRRVALMQESALACAPRHLVRVKGGSYIDKVLHFIAHYCIY